MVLITPKVRSEQVYAWMLNHLKENDNGPEIQELALEAMLEFSLDEEDEVVSELVYDIAAEAKEGIF